MKTLGLSVMLAISMLLTLNVGSALAKDEEKIGLVTASFLNVRVKPGTENAVLTTLPMNTAVQILKERDGWYKVADDGEVLGWVSAKYIQLSSEEVETIEATNVSLSPSACSETCWVSEETRWMPAPKHITGRAVMYAPGLMQATADYNGLDLDGFLGGVSMASLGDVGQVVWLRTPELEGWEGPFLVVDVSGRTSMWEHIVFKQQVVEIDFDTAVRWGMAWGKAGNWGIIRGGMLDVEVYKGLHPPDDAGSIPVVYRDWFLSTAKLGNRGSQNWTIASAEFTNYADYRQALLADR